MREEYDIRSLNPRKNPYAEELRKADSAIVQAIIDARHLAGLTQRELSERTGIAQGDISKLERGMTNPSLRTLQCLAGGMKMRLKLEFVPDLPSTPEDRVSG